MTPIFGGTHGKLGIHPQLPLLLRPFLGSSQVETLNLQDDQNWGGGQGPPNPPEERGGEPLPWYLPHC